MTVTRYAIWPVGMEAEAQAYRDWANANAPVDFTPWTDPAQALRVDASGRPATPVLEYRHPDGLGFEEPAGGEALRVNATLHDMVIWPPDPEDI